MIRLKLVRLGPREALAFSSFFRFRRTPRSDGRVCSSLATRPAWKQRRQQRWRQRVLHFSSLTDNDDNDTIFALSSGTMSSSATAVAVIRITGPEAHAILRSMTKQAPLPTPRKACVRNLYDPMTGSPLDQALVLLFSKPHSFTGQDVVELHCHGSRAVVHGILDCLSSFQRTSSSQDTTQASSPNNENNSATTIHTGKIRMAERGEFTQRAFLHNKLDLLQVEALADLLTADTSTQRQQALEQLSGTLQDLYQDWTKRLVKGLAHAEAVIDFGDDERLDDHDHHDQDSDHDDYLAAQSKVWGGVRDLIVSLRQDMEHHLSDNRRGELVREGVKICIVGPPNVGKSSLFNLLAQREAAIVSPIAGTTRDVLELSLDLGGVKCTLSDTAGVRKESDDVIEQEGMKRARNVAQNADVIVAMANVVDVQKGLSVLQDVLNMIQDEDVLEAPEMKNVLLALNKLDLHDDTGGDRGHTQLSHLPEHVRRDLGGVFEMSCQTNDGIDPFLDVLTKTALARVSSEQDSSSGGRSTERAIITRARHRHHVEAAVEALLRFETLSQQGTMAVDMAAEELRLATSELGRITGAVDVDDVLDVLFTDFCIGK